MKVIWRTRDIPELHPLTPSQRGEVWPATAWRRFKDPVVLMALVVCAALVGLGGASGSYFFGSAIGIVPGVVIGGIIGNAIFWPIVFARSRPYLAAEIQTRGWA